jgi:hypothetical protein
VRVPPQDRHQQDAPAAADIHHGAQVREVIGTGEARRERRCPLARGRVEDFCVLRVPGQELEEWHARLDVESRLPGPERLQDVPERADAAERLQERGP